MVLYKYLVPQGQANQLRIEMKRNPVRDEIFIGMNVHKQPESHRDGIFIVKNNFPVLFLL